MALPTFAPTAELTSGKRAPQPPLNEAQFEALYRRTAAGLWAYVFRMTGDSAAADDIVQKAFFRFLRSNPSLQSEEHTRRYLYRTATNLAVDYFRETKRAQTHLAAVRPVAQFDGRAQGDLRHDMGVAFAELSPRERALLWLAHVEEAGHDEIGAALGLKSKSIRVLLFRARKKLRDILARRGFAPEVKR